jgi:small subunit ribosomal protein S4e
MKRHLKRIGMPKSWPTKRKGIKFIAKPRPGPHKQKECITIRILLKDILNLAKTSKEVKRILNTNTFLVDNIIRKDSRFPLGVMDTILVNNKHYRLILNKKGKFKLLPIKKEELQEKISKIIGKRILKKKKTQINFYDGKNLIVEKDSYKPGDSVILSKKVIKKHLKFEKGAIIYITGGKHIGEIGKLEEIKKHKGITKDTIIMSVDKKKIETSKDYAYVIENESNARSKD